MIAIIGTLAAIATPNYLSYRERARYVLAIKDLRMLSTRIDLYNAEHNEYPRNLAEIGYAGFRDPWGNPYEYLKIDGAEPGRDGFSPGAMRKNRSLVPVNSDYDLFSKGPDGRSRPPFTAAPSQDDIVRANNGGYYGRASDY